MFSTFVPNYLLGKGGYVFGSVGLSVCLSVCLFVCEQHYSKSYERIGMKFYGRVLSSTSKNYLLGKGGYVFGSVGLSVCLSVCL